MINIGKPAHPFYAYIFPSVRIHSASCGFQGIIVWNVKLPIAGMNRISEPCLILLKGEGKLLYTLLRSDYQ